MGFTSPLGNLKSFASSRPPLVVFTLCLTAFALTTYSLAYFIKRAENVPNPDVRLDWNTFILHMAELDFCVLSPEESKGVSSSIQHSSTVTQGALATAATSDDHLNNSSIGITSVLPKVVADQDVKDLNGDNLSVVSLKVTASLSLIQELSTLPHNISTITGTLQAHQLELNVADVSQNATLNVTFHLPAGIQNASQPQEICITFEGPERFLPSTKSPPACYPSPLQSEADSHQAKFVGLRRGPPGQEVFTDTGYGFELWCNEGSIVHMVYHPDPELTVFLTVVPLDP
ncbi:hypothetical protein J437_LFUL016429 [Ladona fulva]|uniref:TMEM248/TMEM219 domain-containing protein n=1 Tax=Ladona fulva TaxID=123851 RepID=A0A8K0KKH4_LADFU|nr:hypothetical protein J437_LFUL016429 [Ladona fulva]